MNFGILVICVEIEKRFLKGKPLSKEKD